MTWKSEEDPLKQCSNKETFWNVSNTVSPYDDSIKPFAFEGEFFDDLDTDIIAPYLIVGVFVIGAGVFATICAYLKWGLQYCPSVTVA